MRPHTAIQFPLLTSPEANPPPQRLGQSLLLSNAFTICLNYVRVPNDQLFANKKYFLHYVKVLWSHHYYKTVLMAVQVALKVLTTDVEAMSQENKKTLKSWFYELMVSELKAATLRERFKAA
jgi:hypothetical protein